MCIRKYRKNVLVDSLGLFYSHFCNNKNTMNIAKYSGMYEDNTVF